METLETQTALKAEYGVTDVISDVDDVGRVKVNNGSEESYVSVWRLTAQSDLERVVLNGLKQTASAIGFSSLRRERTGYVTPGGALLVGRVVANNTFHT